MRADVLVQSDNLDRADADLEERVTPDIHAFLDDLTLSETEIE